MAKHYEWRDDFDWLERAACRGVPPVVFYEDALGDEEEDPLPDGLATARAVCAACPVRRECGDHALHEEQGRGLDSRDGVRAWLTPAQRVSVERRGGLRGADPLSLAQGYDDANDRVVPPIPDDGDRWSRHHTTLAHKALRWLRTNVEPGGVLPGQSVLCEALGARQGPLRVVLDALVADGTLDLHGPAERRVGDNGRTRYYVLRQLPKAVGAWQPQHLRGTP